VEGITSRNRAIEVRPEAKDVAWGATRYVFGCGK